MRIVSSTVELASSRVEYSSSTRKESLKMWVGDEPTDSPRDASRVQGAGALLRIEAAASVVSVVASSEASLSTQAAPELTEDAASGDPADWRKQATLRQQVDLAILERHFKLKVKVSATEVERAYSEGAQQAAETSAAVQQPTGNEAPAAPAREGWGLRYDAVETTERYEATRFAARAQVATADGRQIDVQAALEMARAEVQTSEIHVVAGDAAKIDPLVVNLQGGAASFAGTSEFDLDADGTTERIATLAGGSAYLALDANGNGTIDDGSELFGPTTGSGFGELAALDQDQNGWVDEGDDAFSELRLWSPGSGQLGTLAAANVGALYTGSASTQFDLKDQGGALQGTIAQTGIFLREDGTVGTVQHVDLAV